MCSNINDNHDHDEPDVIVYNASKWHVAIKGISDNLVSALQELGYVVFVCDCCDKGDDGFVQSINLLNSGNFTDGQDLFMYDWQNGEKQVGVIHELLHDNCRRLSVALSAYGKADKNHRWKNRVQQILSALNLLYGVEMK